MSELPSVFFYYHNQCADGNRFEYLWQDSENYKRPTKMSAPAYIEHLMAWIQGNIDNEELFPSRTGTSPPSPSCSIFSPSILSLILV